jgi:D-glycero-D-manno-heptose 1,7-bisphosphate phosphatase
LTPLGHVQFVFLDRDGVINRKPFEGEYVTTWENFEFLPGAAGAIAELNHSGRRVIIATDQRAIALGKLTHAGLEGIHRQMQAALLAENARIDAIYYCPHDVGQCGCRKPATGMIEAAFADFPAASAASSCMIGDSLSDIEAGRRMGMATVFIRGERGRQKPGADAAERLASFSANSLAEAVQLFGAPSRAAKSF